MDFALRRHRFRYLLFLSVRWRRRAIFVLGGVAVGAASVAFAKLADFAQLEFQRLLLASPSARYAPMVVMPLAFAALVLITNKVFPNSQGSGIPQAIAARRLTDQAARGRLVSARIAVGKVLVTLLGLLCGASVGREGPSVQVGASIMFLVGRLSPSKQPGLILAGAAAGVAAAFNTPLAGIVFGIEEMSRSFEIRASGLIIGAVIAAGLTSLTLVGNYSYFGTTDAALQLGTDWLAVPVCGVVGGALGGLFSRILVEVARGLPGTLGRWIKQHPIPFAAICGGLTALTGLVSGSTTYGTGYEQVSGLLDGSHGMPQSFGLLKLAATVFSSISGLPGGIFSPSLAVGGGLGANIATFFPHAPIGALILLGMVAYFTGVVQAPITAFVIVTEMTNNHALLVPLMLASVIAYSTSRLICPTGVYHALAENFLRPAPRGETRSP
ncbi:MAG TPA: chloride channel protein [Stellaceae bacterium]|nr:chloride channel protein [Stellaceae bacterium]